MVSRIVRRLGAAVVLAPMRLLAAPAGKTAAVVIVADTRHLTGMRAWWANVYNESHLQFALVTVIVVPVAAILLGSLADFLMSRVGIDLKSRVVKEG